MFFSKLQVNSSNSIFFSLLFNITRSGLKLVARMSGGIVPPFNQSEGRSARISRFGTVIFIMVMAKWFKTELWRQVNLPSFRATGHQFSMCSNELGHLHNSHLSVFRIPHLFRLSGVLSPLEHAFKANERTPLGMLLEILCQVTFSFSSIRSFKKSP